MLHADELQRRGVVAEIARQLVDQPARGLLERGIVSRPLPAPAVDGRRRRRREGRDRHRA
jgi:hypothetical protein